MLVVHSQVGLLASKILLEPFVFLARVIIDVVKQIQGRDQHSNLFISFLMHDWLWSIFKISATNHHSGVVTLKRLLECLFVTLKRTVWQSTKYSWFIGHTVSVPQSAYKPLIPAAWDVGSVIELLLNKNSFVLHLINYGDLLSLSYFA